MKKRLLVVSGILLAILIVFPALMILASWNLDFANLGNRAHPMYDTDIQSYFASAAVLHQTLFTILAVGEVVLLAAFVLTLRAAFREIVASSADSVPSETQTSRPESA